MKKIIYLMTLIFFATGIKAQTLLDTYKKGTLNLTEDPGYAQNTDWNKLFDDRNSIVYGNPVGKMKSIAVSEQGELYVGNYGKYNIYKFDKNGNFIKEFGKKGSKNSDFLYRPTLHGVLDDKYVFASDHQGRILFFDLDGNFKKMVKLDYMPLQITPLKDNKIAILGHVPYHGDVRNIVAIKDIETNKEIIVDSYLNSLINLKPIIVKDKNGYMFGFSPSALNDKTIIARTFDGNLILGHNVEPKLTIFNTEGIKLSEININQEKVKTSNQDKEEFINEVKDFLIKKDIYEENKELLNDTNIYPEYFPLYYLIMSDPEGNTLVFNYSEEKGNSFLVYDKSGKFICETVIKSKVFKLDINSRFSSFEIHPDGLYAFVTVIDSETSEIKIIRTVLK